MSPDMLFKKLFGFLPSKYSLIRSLTLSKLGEVSSMTPIDQKSFFAIVDNITKDKFKLKKRLLTSLLVTLARSTDSLRQIFVIFFNKNKLKGKRINSAPKTVGMATGIEKLSSDLSNKKKLTDYEGDTGVCLPTLSSDAWRDTIHNIIYGYLGLPVNEIIKRQENDLRFVPMNFYLQWSTFCLADSSKCPFQAAGDDQEMIWRNLGLSENLGKGMDLMLLFTFEPSSVSIKYKTKTFHKPTAVDAGWNPGWAPSPTPSFGMTKPHPGGIPWPEIVHRPVMGPILCLPLRLGV